jgi:hypothetical protein
MGGIQMVLLGGRGFLDTQIVTTGGSGVSPDRLRGYDSSPSLGSIFDGTSNIYSGGAITELYWDENGGGGAQRYRLTISGATNSGWTTLTIGNETLLRTSATFNSFTQSWTWSTADLIFSQAFGDIGSTVTCTFT